MAELNPCIIKALKFKGKEFTREQIIEIGKEVEGAIKDLRRSLPLEWHTKADEFKIMRSKQVKVEALSKKKDLIFHILGLDGARAQNRIRVEGGLNEAKALNSFYSGVERSAPRAKRSIMAMQKAEAKDFQASYLGKFDSQQLDVYRKGHLDKQIITEKYESAPGGKPGKTGNPEALRISKLNGATGETFRIKQNNLGATRDRLWTWHPFVHDGGLARKAGFENWKSKILDRANMDSTIAPYINKALTPEAKVKFIDVFMEEAYLNIITGQRKLHVSDAGFVLKKGESLAKKLSRNRVFIWKNADAEIDMRNEFSSMNIFESMYDRIYKDAHNTVLLREMGPRPQAVDDVLRADVANAFRKKDITAPLDTSATNTYWREITQENSETTMPTMAKWFTNFRSVQNLSKLGGVSVTALVDTPMIMYAAHTNGMSILEPIRRGMERFAARVKAGGVEAKEAKELLSMMGIINEYVMGSVSGSRFFADDIAGGIIGKANENLFKYVGLSGWNTIWREAIAFGYSANLARNVGKSVDGLNPNLANTLNKYGIGKSEWNAIRTMDTKSLTGEKFIVAENVSTIADDAIDRIIVERGQLPTTEAGLKAQRERIREELRSSLITYFVTEVDFALPTPGARQRAFTRAGSAAHPIVDQVIKSFSQYKIFPLMIAQEHVGRMLHGGPGGKLDIVGMPALVIGATVMGYISMSIRDAENGKTPRALNRLETWLEAFARGGAAGLYGDFLTGDLSRYGNGLAETFGGPLFSEAKQVLGIALSPLELLKGKSFEEVIESDLSRSYRFLMNNVPYGNFHLNRMAFNYLVGYQISESLNPGSLKRIERAAEERGQNYIFASPREHVR